MIKEKRSLSESKLIRYLAERPDRLRSTYTSNKGISELFYVADKVQQGGNLTTEGLEAIATKIAEINRYDSSVIIEIMGELNKYCNTYFEREKEE